MRSRNALIAAGAAAAVAVSLVALDLAWNVTVRVDSMEDGEWKAVAEDDGAGYYDRAPFRPGPDCVSGVMRVVVDNDRPFGSGLDVRVAITDSGGATEVILEETWDLARFATRSAQFEVPALPPPQNGTFQYGELIVEVGDTYLSMCRGSSA